jgi:predicted ribosomally synthesized peptide with SipW-like signal peptide
MSDTDDGLSRRKVLGGITTVGAAGAVAGAGTYALFTDGASADATVETGEVSLSEDQSLDMTITDMLPGEEFTGTFKVTYTGTTDAELYAWLELTGDTGLADALEMVNQADNRAAWFEDASVNADSESDHFTSSNSISAFNYDVVASPQTLTELQAEFGDDPNQNTSATPYLTVGDGDEFHVNLKVELPETTGNTHQNSSLDVSLNVLAVQEGGDLSNL